MAVIPVSLAYMGAFVLAYLPIAVSQHMAACVTNITIPASFGRHPREYEGVPAQGKRPNILLVLSDQQRYDFDGFHEGIPLEMPNFRRLATEGVRFTSVFSPSPLCSPSRVAMAVGRQYHETVGHVASFLDGPPKKFRTYYQALRDDGGYHTMTCGKDDLVKGAAQRGGGSAWDAQSLKNLGFSDGERSLGKKNVYSAKHKASDQYGDFLLNFGAKQSTSSSSSVEDAEAFVERAGISTTATISTVSTQRTSKEHTSESGREQKQNKKRLLRNVERKENGARMKPSEEEEEEEEAGYEEEEEDGDGYEDEDDKPEEEEEKGGGGRVLTNKGHRVLKNKGPPKKIPSMPLPMAMKRADERAVSTLVPSPFDGFLVTHGGGGVENGGSGGAAGEPAAAPLPPPPTPLSPKALGGGSGSWRGGFAGGGGALSGFSGNAFEALDASYSNCVHENCEVASWMPSELQEDNFVGRKALQLLRRRPKQKPFFLQVNFPSPHDPYTINTCMDNAIRRKPNGHTAGYPGQHASSSLTSTSGRAGYAALVELIDVWLGKLISELEAEDADPTCCQDDEAAAKSPPAAPASSGSAAIEFLPSSSPSSSSLKEAAGSIFAFEDDGVAGSTNVGGGTNDAGKRREGGPQQRPPVSNRLSVLDVTLVCFSSDHGDMLGDGGKWGKQVPGQGSIGVPLVCRGPAGSHFQLGGRSPPPPPLPASSYATFLRGAVVTQPVGLVDLAATFLDLAKVPKPRTMSSRSLLKVLFGVSTPHDIRPVVVSALNAWRVGVTSVLVDTNTKATAANTTTGSTEGVARRLRSPSSLQQQQQQHHRRQHSHGGRRRRRSLLVRQKRAKSSVARHAPLLALPPALSPPLPSSPTPGLKEGVDGEFASPVRARKGQRPAVEAAGGGGAGLRSGGVHLTASARPQRAFVFMGGARRRSESESEEEGKGGSTTEGTTDGSSSGGSSSGGGRGSQRADGDGSVGKREWVVARAQWGSKGQAPSLDKWTLVDPLTNDIVADWGRLPSSLPGYERLFKAAYS